jgi:hypothetical protein
VSGVVGPSSSRVAPEAGVTYPTDARKVLASERASREGATAFDGKAGRVGRHDRSLAGMRGMNI